METAQTDNSAYVPTGNLAEALTDNLAYVPTGNLAFHGVTRPNVASHKTRISLKKSASIEMLPSQVTNQTILQLATGTQVYLPQLPGSSMDDSLKAVEIITRNRLAATPHLAARSVPSPEALDSWLGALTDLGCHRIFLIAGDPNQQSGPYKDSLQLLESGLLEKHSIRHIGVAGHPDGHEHVDAIKLKDALAQKRAYATAHGVDMWVVTQFMFDIPLLSRWLNEWDESLATLPVHIGIAGPANMITLLRYAARCGVTASAKVLAKNPASMKLLGSWNPDGQMEEIEQRCGDKIGERIGGIHLFPFGGLKKAAGWLEEE
jgi:methylenetetrahydrofolate reductase (NADPH)